MGKEAAVEVAGVVESRLLAHQRHRQGAGGEQVAGVAQAQAVEVLAEAGVAVLLQQPLEGGGAQAAVAGHLLQAQGLLVMALQMAEQPIQAPVRRLL